MILGAVLAGGRSSRFGSDKAVALLDGQSLLDRVIAQLRAQTDAVVVCGRDVPGLPCVPDRPAPDLGPLGGLNAALQYAAKHGFEAVISAPCDTPFLPDDLIQRLAESPASYVAAMPVIGRWPASLAGLLDEHLATTTNRSMRHWIEIAQAVPIAFPHLANVNTLDDLAALET